MNARRYELDVNGKHFSVAVKDFSAETAELEINGASYVVGVKDVTTEVKAYRPPPRPLPPPALPLHHANHGTVRVGAPIPGQITSVMVKKGDRVSVGQPLAKMEAMKMVNTIRSTASGVVERVSIQAGDVVNQNQEMLLIR